MLLPVIDKKNSALSFRIFEDVEEYLQESNWCYYRPNSEILNIFYNYNNGLDNIINDPNVLSAVSEKVRAGSLIQIEVKEGEFYSLLSLKVYGANGSDIYFAKEQKLGKKTYDSISKRLRKWLSEYKDEIPYDGRIVGILGDSITIDVGRNQGLSKKTKVILLRPIGKQTHPLLKQVANWEVNAFAESDVLNLNDSKSVIKITNYTASIKARIGDWVKIGEKLKPLTVSTSNPIKIENAYKFGKLGHFNFGLNVGSATSINTTGVNLKKISGLFIGGEIGLELWATRNYWIGVDYRKVAGSAEAEEGILINTTSSEGIGQFEIKAGYRYLPLGFFYGPQLNGYIGYASYSFLLETSLLDGFTSLSYSGFLLGFNGSVPVRNIITFIIDLSFIWFPTYTEEFMLYGEDNSSTAYSLDVILKYNYRPNMTWDLGYGVVSARSIFQNPNRTLNRMGSFFKFGSTFTF